MIIGLEHISHVRLRDLELFRLRKRRLQEDVYSTFQYLNRAYKKAGEGHIGIGEAEGG